MTANRWPTPESTRRSRLVYEWLASIASGIAMFLFIHQHFIWAAACGVAAIGLLCVVMLGIGFVDGYKEGHRHATADGEAALDALDESWLALSRPCEISVEAATGLPGEGYIYVILFSTGVVKVGQTLDLRRRFAEHRRDAEAYNVVITNYWVSGAHVNYLDNEIELIGFCDGFGARAKREYFHDINFDIVVRFAAGLAYSTNDQAAMGVDR